jgi:hypothetical protein
MNIIMLIMIRILVMCGVVWDRFSSLIGIKNV